MFRNKKSSIYLCGDFNINLLNYDYHKGTRDFLDSLFTLGLYPLIDKPSRITEYSATLIDNIFTNELNIESKSGLILNDLSDHLPVFCVCDYKIQRKCQKKSIFVRNIDQESLSKFKNQLVNENWDDMYNSINVNDAYDNFIKVFTHSYNECCPVKNIIVDVKSVKKPWMSNGLRNACKKKNRLYVKFLKQRSTDAEERYKKYKNKLTSILRYCEKEYYTNLLECQKNNVKGTWKVLNKIIRKKNTSSKFPESFKDKNNVISDKKQIANGFNRFFTNVGPDLASSIPIQSKNVHDYRGSPNLHSMLLLEVTESEILKIVKDLCNKSSTDCDDISMNVLKSVFTSVIKPFLFVCNKSFMSGVFPDRMKVAKVIPLYKSGEKNVFTNYRPVSLLPQFSKILEKLFNNRLDNFVEKYNLLNESQYGFRNNRSTSLALLELIEDITTSLDNKKSTIGVFIDLKKAFDTIDHNLLLQKLEHFGIRGITYEWIKSYLSNRTQYVQIDDVKSDLLNVICGVPQGSILGPKLFILYINDICKVSDIFRFVLFADDTNLFCSGDDIKTLASQVCTELDKLRIWFAVNKLSLNVSKTNFMLFSNCKIKDIVDIKINNCDVERVYVTKFLGVLIDHKLNWKEHIVKVNTKLCKSISIIYRASRLLNSNALYTLYCTLFLPYLSYCIEVWGNTYKTNIVPLFLKQKKVIRIICKAKYLDHTSELFHKLNVLNVFHIIEQKTAIFMYKAYHLLLPYNLQKYFEKSDCVRKPHCFKQRYVRTTKKQHCVSTNGVKLWNSLTNNLKSCKNVYQFKKLLKQKLLSSYI